MSSFASTQICLTEWTKLCSGWPTVNLRQQTSGSGDVLAKVLVHHWHGPGTCDIAPAIFPLLERFKMRRAVPLVHQHARSTRFGVVTKTKTKATRCQCVTSWKLHLRPVPPQPTKKALCLFLAQNHVPRSLRLLMWQGQSPWCANPACGRACGQLSRILYNEQVAVKSMWKHGDGDGYHLIYRIRG